MERKKTGSLYGLRNMYKQLVQDEKPFQIRAAVRGKNVQIRLNGELLVDYVEPTPPVIPAGGEKERFLDHGTFALQCHNAGSQVSYSSVRVRPLPDDLPLYTGLMPVVDNVYREVIDIGRHNIPMVDYHVFLRKGLTLTDARRKSCNDGIQYGITANTAAIRNDVDASRWLQRLIGKPVFFALSAVTPGWTRNFSQNTIRRFDYILADSLSWQSPNGHLVDLANPYTTDSITAREAFMDTLVDQAVKRFDTEPIDIYTHPTYLPQSMRASAADHWTKHRTAKLIDGLLRNKVAVEINTLDRLPNQAFILEAKDAGCKFAFGTANTAASDLTRCEYGLQMVETCKLDWHDFFVPGSWWPKAVERAWPSANS